MPEVFVTIDDVRRAASALSGAGNPNGDKTERVAWIFSVLNRFAYARRTREEKGLIRQHLQDATGYSRAQIARYITMHQKSPAPAPTVEAIVTSPIAESAVTPKPVVARHGNRLMMAGMLTMLFAIIAVQQPPRAALTIVDRPTTSQNVPRVTLVSTVIADDRGRSSVAPLVVFDDTRYMAAGVAASGIVQDDVAGPPSPDVGTDVVAIAETRTTFSFLRNVAARREARLARSENLKTAASLVREDLYAFGPGHDGQVLTVENGKMVWKDLLPSIIEQMRRGNANPIAVDLHGSAGGNVIGSYDSIIRGIGRNPNAVTGYDQDGRAIRSYGGGGGGGGGGTSGGGTSTTTTITTTTTIENDGGFTDDGAFVRLTTASDNVAIGTTTGSVKFQVAGSGAFTSGRVSIGKARATTALDVIGTVSGSNIFSANSITGSLLYASIGFSGAGLTDCDTGATSKLLWDASTKQFACGVDQGGVGASYAAGQGLSLSVANVFRLNATISGSLVRFNTLSGSVVYAKTSLGSSGSLVVDGNASIDDSTFFVNSATNRVGIGTFTPDATLEIIGTASGQNLFAASSVTGSHLYAAITFGGAGLTDCDTAGTSKLLWDSTNKVFSCGTDQNAQWSGTGALQTAFDSRYVNTSGDTMTGALRINVSGIGLRVTDTLSGSILHAERALTSSGSLRINGVMTGTTALYGAGLSDCDATTGKLLWNAATGRFSCGTDQNGGGGAATGSLTTAFDRRYVNVSGDTMTGALRINRNGFASGGVLLHVNGTMSGRSLQVTGTGAGPMFFTHIKTGFIGIGTASPEYPVHITDTNGIAIKPGSRAYRMYVSDPGGTFVLGRSDSSNTVSIDPGTSKISATAAFGISAGSTALYLNVGEGGGGGSVILGKRQSDGLVLPTTYQFFGGNVGMGSGTPGSRLAVSGSVIINTTQNGILTAKSALHVVGSGAFTGTLSGSALNIQGGTSYIRGSLGIGTTTPETALEVIGTISGSILRARTAITSSGSLRINGVMTGATALYGAGLSDCDPTTGKLLWNAATGRFSCGTDQSGGAGTFGSGNVVTLTDRRFVNTSGDTMTGGLLIVSGSSTASIDAGLLLEIAGTASGRTIRAMDSLMSSGTLVVRGNATFDTNTLFVDAANNRVGVGTISPDATLEILGTASGTNLFATKSITGSHLYAAITFGGAGLTDCDTAGTSKLLWDSTNKVFSCGTDAGSSSMSQTDADVRYVNVSGDTMTGALNIQNGNIHTTTSVPLLNVRGTMSGRSLWISGSGAGTSPLFATYNPTGTMIMGTGAIKSGTGQFLPQLYIAGRSGSGVAIAVGSTATNISVPYDVAVQGQYAYIASSANNSLTVVDITNASNPKSIASATTGLSSPRAVSVQGRYAYIVSYLNARLEIFDVSNPSSPALAGFTTNGLSGPLNVAVQGSYAYVVDNTLGRLLVYDVSNPATPTLQGFTTTNISGPASLVVQGRYVYVANQLAGIAIFDISNPAAPLNVGASSNGLSLPTDIDVQGRYAYVVNGGNNRLAIFDISNPASPSLTGFTSTGLHSPHSAVVQGRYAYVTSQNNARLVVFDISNPSSPIWLGATNSGLNGPTGIEVQGRYTYVVNINGLRIFDLGGSYIQQLEVGGLEAADLSVRNTLRVLDGDFRGGVTIGRSLEVNGPSSFVNASSGAFTLHVSALSRYPNASGALAISAYGSSRASHILFGSGGTNFDTNLYRSTVNRLKTDDSLWVVGALSGSILHAERALTSSGSLRINGVMTGATALYGAGLSDCDPTTGKLLWNAATGRFSCGTDQSGGAGTFGSGNVVTLTDRRFVNTAGDTMTGGLLIVSGSSTASIDAGLLLEIAGTASGRTIRAMDSLMSSGTLVVRGNATFDTNTLFVDAANDRIGVGTTAMTYKMDVRDITAGTSDGLSLSTGVPGNPTTNTVILAPTWDTGLAKLSFGNANGAEILVANNDGSAPTSLRINAAKVSLGRGVGAPGSQLSVSGAVIINPNGALGTSAADANVALEIIGTASGRVLRAQDTIASSGSLIIRKIAGSSTGNILVVDTIGLIYDATNKRVGIGTAAPAEALDVRSATTAVARLDGVAGSTLQLATNNTPKWSFYTSAAGSDIFRIGVYAGSDLFTLTPTYKIGLGRGNTSPGASISISGATIINANGNVGTVGPDSNVALEVIGTISGSVLRARTAITSSGSLRINGVMTGATALYGAGLSDCDPTTGKLLWNAATGRFSCGTDQNSGSGNFGSGNVIAVSERRYVNTSGDTMTGGLLIVSGSSTASIDAGLLLEIAGTASGRILHAQDILRSSGSLVIEGNATFDVNTLFVDATNNRVGIGTAAPGAALHVLDAMRIEDEADNTHYFQIEPVTGFFGNFPRTLFQGGNSTSDTNWQMRFADVYSSAGTEIPAGIQLTSNNDPDYTNTDALFVVAGPTVHGIWTDEDNADGKAITIHTDADGFTYATPNLYLDTTANGNRVGIRTTAPKTTLEIIGVGSGSELHATRQLRSSGTLTVAGNTTIDTNTLFVDATNNRVGIGTTAPKNELEVVGTISGAGLHVSGRFASKIRSDLVVGSSLNLLRAKLAVSGSVFISPGSLSTTGMDHNIALEVIGTISGSVLRATTAITSSGSLRIAGTMTGATALYGAGLSDCDAVTGKLLWNAATGRFSCGTDQTGGGSSNFGSGNVLAVSERRYVNTSGDTMTGGLLIVSGSSTASIDAGLLLEIAGTASGRTIRAMDSLMSSGTLVVRGPYPVTTLTASAITRRVGIGTGSPGSTLSLSGAMIINPNGTLGSTAADAGLALEIIGTASGRTIRAMDSLMSSGTLVVRGNSVMAGNLTVDSTTFTVSASANTVTIVGDTDGQAVGPLIVQAVAGGATIGTSLTLDATAETGGKKFSFISTGPGAGAGAGAFSVYNGTDDRYVFQTNDLGEYIAGQNQYTELGQVTVYPYAVSEKGIVIRGFAGQTANLQEWQDSNATVLASIDKAGSGYFRRALGVGTSTPGSKLSVSGAVIINPTGTLGSGRADANIALEIIGTASGRVIRATDSLVSSGTLVVRGPNPITTFTANASNRRVGIGTGAPGSTLSVSGSVIINSNGTLASTAADAGVSLEVVGTISGSILRARTAITSSGSLRINGVMSGATAIYGAGLQDCNATTGKLLWSAATGRFSCGTDQSSAFGSGNVITLTDRRFVNTAGDTMTGGLLIVSGSSTATIDSGLLFEVAGAMSGRTLRIQDQLNASGAVVIKKYAGSSTGNILVVDTKGLVYDATNKRVGIGTTTPLQPLSIYRADSDPAIHFQARTTPTSATSSGPLSPATTADDAGVGTVVWNNTANATSQNDTFADAQLDTANSTSHYLKVTNHSFTIPDGATINGIVVEVDKNSTGNPDVFDHRARIVKGGSIGATDRSSGTAWAASDTDTYTTYGSSSDLWGETWTAADINASNFGFAIAAINTCLGCAIVEPNTFVDHIRITVHYTPAFIHISRDWTMGVDHSDAGKFKLSSSGGALGLFDLMTVTATGSFGFGTTSPNAKARLAVSGSVLIGPNLANETINSSNIPQGSLVMSNGMICVDNGGNNCDDSSRTAGTIYANNSTVQGIDVAENYPTKDTSLMPGDVVALDPHHPVFVRRATGEPGETLVGIVSTEPGLLLGGFGAQQFADEWHVPVALSGRVPLKVTASGGAIRIGDMLTATYTGSGALTGSGSAVARLAQRGEQTIGYALESFSGTGTGLIQTFVNVIKVDAPGLEPLTELTIDSETSSGSTTLFSIRSDVGHDENTVFRVTASGAVYADGQFYSTGADYAEWFRVTGSEVALEPGELVCIDVAEENAVRRCDRAGDDNLMGIVSTHPAYIGNHILGADDVPADAMKQAGYALIGLIGQVPALVNDEGGPIRAGDELTAASVPGYARRAAPGEPTVGVAMEYMEKGTGVVNVLISRRNSSLTVETVESKIVDAIADMELEDEVNILFADAMRDLNLRASVNAAVEDALTDSPLMAQVQALIDLTSGAGGLEALMGDIDATALTAMFGGNLTMTGSLHAASADTEGNLTVGGDARIASDLHVDGDMRVNGTFEIDNLFVPGMIVVDGSMKITKDLDVGRITVGTGSVFEGSVTVMGNLQVAEGSVIFASGTTLDLADLNIRGGLRVVGPLTVESLAVFLGDVDVHGELIVSGRQAGYARIRTGADSVTVRFATGFVLTPVVTASPDVPVLYAVSRATGTGFVIRLAASATEDVGFSWLALVTAAPGESDETVIATPVRIDAAGVPILDSDEANACIRNVLPLGEDGRPTVNCDRYHDDYDWFLDSAGIRLRYNTQLTPSLQPAPEGYVYVVDEAWTFQGSVSTSSEASSSSMASSEGSSATSSDGSVTSEGASSSASSEASSVTSEETSSITSEASSASEASSEASSEESSSESSGA